LARRFQVYRRFCKRHNSEISFYLAIGCWFNVGFAVVAYII
jgi:hypothetical protein